MEGIPDHHEPSAFTSRRSRWSRRLSHTPGNAGEGRAHREWQEGEATGMSEARSVEGAVGVIRPRSLQQQANYLRGTRPRHTQSENSVSSIIRRSVSSAVKALGPPVKLPGAQTHGGAHAVKAAAA